MRASTLKKAGVFLHMLNRTFQEREAIQSINFDAGTPWWNLYGGFCNSSYKPTKWGCPDLTLKSTKFDDFFNQFWRKILQKYMKNFEFWAFQRQVGATIFWELVITSLQNEGAQILP